MSAVTAVPIRPLARGAVLKLWIALLLLALAAAGLAWWGTRVWQMNTLDSGVRYRVSPKAAGRRSRRPTCSRSTIGCTSTASTRR